ncbi:MAG: RNA polymerase sigma factor FliA [Pseudohongiellaceae bacterium]
MYTESGKIDQDAFIAQYLPLVRRQALALQVKLPSSIDLDDLIQAGAVGLLDALSRFDSAAGASFRTFATQRIHGAMIDELRSRDWLPRSARRKARAMESCIRSLEQKLQRPPGEAEIAAELEMDLAEYRQLLNDTNNGFLVPFEAMVAEGDEPAARQDSSSSPFEALFQGEGKKRLAEAIETLPEREKQLLALYYQEDLNLKEIGLVLGVTESRVCQLHSQALGRLRTRLGDS